MPNNVTNEITFGTDRAALSVFRQMLEDVRAEDGPLGSIDFNQLIPMPPELMIEEGSRTRQGLKLYRGYVRELSEAAAADTAALWKKWAAIRGQSPELWALGEQAYRNSEQYGHPTWYSWRVAHWGSKWNAYSFKPLSENDPTMTFQTAWSAVPQIVVELSRRYPQQTVRYRWADENIGFNVGEMKLLGGEVTDWNLPPQGSREAYEMAADIMHADLADWGICFREDGTIRLDGMDSISPPEGKSRREPDQER